MKVLSDIGIGRTAPVSCTVALTSAGIPRDIRHISGNGIHTFRFINDNGESQLFKWYWIPSLSHRSLVYDEVQKIQGKINDFQRV